MAQRIDYAKVAPGGLRAIMGVESWVQQSGLDATLIHLTKLRASYMNGCAYCVDMHSKDARVAGETEQRIYSVPVWRETPFYSARERAALLWTEVVTELGREGVSDAVYEDVRSHFSEEELAQLTIAVVAINMWNRLAIALGADVGSYQPANTASSAAAA
jgi:AhpD family alkylhydroperoxidase